MRVAHDLPYTALSDEAAREHAIIVACAGCALSSSERLKLADAAQDRVDAQVVRLAGWARRKAGSA